MERSGGTDLQNHIEFSEIVCFAPVLLYLEEQTIYY